MASPQNGQPFPDFELDRFSTRVARSGGPLLVVVWRTECPTCRLMMPFLERLHRFYKAASVAGIAQNQPDEVKEFTDSQKITFSNYADTTLRITHFLGVSTVPAYWLIGKDGKVLQSAEGWDRGVLEQAAQTIASQTSSAYAPLFAAADQVPAMKPG
ncbi:MAG: hypothetical protein QOJ65_1732 [Fimbriimonadaceae bacterium]|nr:hypothetical protein [Fimbriimonadaceae bacterium]